MLAPVPLREVLASLGYSCERSGPNRKRVLLDGRVVFDGQSTQIWAWLRKTGQIKEDANVSHQ